MNAPATTRSFWNGGCTTRWLRAIPTCLTRPSTTHSAGSPTRQAPRWKPGNRAFHRLLVDGVTVEYPTQDGSIRGAQARVVDFENPDANSWLAVNQFTVSENKNTRRADIVLFLNGLPLAVIELKNPADEDATIWIAWNQLQTYKAELPTLFSMNEALIVSDGIEARIGALTAQPLSPPDPVALLAA